MADLAPRRLPRGNRRAVSAKVVVLVVDGLPVELLDGALPDLPFIRARLPFRGTAVSCFPSTTGPAYFPLIAGCTPGRANVPGIRWFDRTRPTRSPFPHRGLRSYVGPGARKSRTDTSAETIFARHAWPVSSPVAKDLPRASNVSRDLIWGFSRVAHTWEEADRRTDRRLGPALRKGREVVFGVFPSVDEFGHVYGLAAGRSRAALAAIDRMLARRLGDFDGEIVLAADHGLTDTHTHLDLRALVERVVGPTLAYPFIGRRDPRAVVCESGNGMANVYLRGAGGWRERPAYDRCRQVALELIRVEGIDSVAVRGREEHSAELHTRHGPGMVGFADDGLFQHGDAFEGEFARADPAAALARSIDEQNPDAAFSLTSLFASERTGDLLVSAEVGYDLRTWREWPEHRASHGALHRGHTLVPVLASAPLPEPPLRTLDLFCFTLALAGVPLEAYPRSDAFLLARGSWRPGVCA